jgi:hypothetical protein
MGPCAVSLRGRRSEGVIRTGWFSMRTSPFSARIPLLLMMQLAAIKALASGQTTWSLEVLIGDAYNFSSQTQIEHVQVGAASFGGDYETRGFEGPLHYAGRVAHWQDDRAWELQFLHHKLYLRNRPPAVEMVSVSHGFNIVTLNRAFKLDRWLLRVGVGPVIAHPEARISGSPYDGPYEVGGAAAMAGIGRSFALTRRLFLHAEFEMTFGYIDVHPEGSPDLDITFSIPQPMRK